jgi:hypothetical protein
MVIGVMTLTGAFALLSALLMSCCGGPLRSRAVSSQFEYCGSWNRTQGSTPAPGSAEYQRALSLGHEPLSGLAALVANGSHTVLVK